MKFKITQLVFMLCINVTFAQTIDKSKRELTAKPNPPAQSSGQTTTTQKSTSTNNSSSSFASEAGAEVFLFLFKISLGAAYYGGIGDYQNENQLYNNLTTAPYTYGNTGNYSSRDSVLKKNIRIDVENSFLYKKNLFGNHLKVKIRPSKYFYFQTDFHQLFELDPFTDKYDQLPIYQINFCYDRLRLDKFNLGWTLGATYIGDEVKKTGFSYGLNFEYFLESKISFFGGAKWSTINQKPVNFYELQGRFHQKSHYFSLGLEHHKIASPTYNFISLGAGIYF